MWNNSPPLKNEQTALEENPMFYRDKCTRKERNEERKKGRKEERKKGRKEERHY